MHYSIITLPLLFLSQDPLLPYVLAYTDPGTGLLLWQLLIGAILGTMFFFRRSVAWLRALVLRKKNQPGPAQKSA